MKAFVLNGDENSQKLILQACIPFIDLKDKARFTFRGDPSANPYSIKTSNEENYQRQINQNRVKDIGKYLRMSILQNGRDNNVAVIFPTAMLLAFNSDDLKDSETNFKIGHECNVDLPNNNVYIVDGQHRLYSMIELYRDVSSSVLSDDLRIKKYLENYVYNCTLLMNFDMWEQGQVFADVNFNQKRVNKSLYYDIYGIEYPENTLDRNKNYIYIAHQLVKFMNETKESPFYHHIKMLGTGKGYFSQACLAEALMKHMATPLGIWYIKSDNLPQKPNYRYMAVELISFYTCIKDMFKEYWPKDNSHVSILCKTTGVNAMMQLMGYIHQSIASNKNDVVDNLKDSNSYISQPYIEAITPVLLKLLPYGDNLFGLDGDYGGTGGSGLSSKLYKRMRDIIRNHKG